ncbi:DUF3261 domain-containing protein [Rheinheimera salexigens]|uniref:DUF3261 domain-containing protein n=1 Tax=Rheinheimera salexigens TaxID=1628148 RepID=A0A1E7Q2X1_9GAMM|nr:DUF3261 domain-containing protein [Rheinheimera salexigens]OEY68413.1 hypothetical protein BI198_01650 [Rheinheimera salexigens]
MYRVILMFALLLSGCQSKPAPDAGWTAFGKGYYQLSDAWPGQSQQILQQVIWLDEQQQQQQFIISALLQPEAVLLIAISPLGQELWRLNYQPDHQLTVSGMAPFNQPEFAKTLLAQMQIALFSEEKVRSRLLQLTIQQSANERGLYDKDGKQLLQITNSAQLAVGQSITITAPIYSLKITTLQQDFLP